VLFDSAFVFITRNYARQKTPPRYVQYLGGNLRQPAQPSTVKQGFPIPLNTL
jgi:hypothetical protein